MIVAILALAATTCSLAAESGSKGYSFRIQAHQNNTSVATPLYRDVATNNSGVPWYVLMTSSQEGTGTITRYWLEKSDGTNVSPDCDAKQGTAYHPAAYDYANKKYVYLTAENNTDNSDMYTVSGYWKAKSSY